MMHRQPSIGVADDLRQAARLPFDLSLPETMAPFSQRAEEIELLRLALSDAMTRDPEALKEGR